MSGADSLRREELEGSLYAVRERIAAAARAHGRGDEDIDLIVVTKFFPAEDLIALVSLGVTSIGESRDQEAAAKIEALRSSVGSEAMPLVHMVGQVQTKKARSVVRYADVVHSVDREKLIARLDRSALAAVEEGERSQALDVTIQVDLGNGQDEARGGVAPQGCEALAEQVAHSEGLRLRGLMAVAPDPAELDPRSAFERLAVLHQDVLAHHPDATWLSAGMSGDLEEAVAVGATHLRVGSAILGSRYSER